MRRRARFWAPEPSTMASSPRMLLVDEPPVGLAPILVSRVIAKIKELVHGTIEFEGGARASFARTSS